MSNTLPDQMLQVMSDGGWRSQEELTEAISHRFSATMHTLKKRGYQFERRHVQGQRYEYRLILSTQQEIA